MHSVDLTQWVFALADDPAACRKGFDDSAWRPVTVPHDWAVELEFSPECSSGTGYLPGGVGWYRTHVPLADLGPTADRHLRLVFSGAYKNADVWANGYHLGGRPSGHAEFSFDLTEIVSYAPDEDLVIAVRVEHTDISDSRWYNGSGLTRQVALEVHEQVRLAEHATTFTTLAADAQEATVAIAQTVVSDLAHDVSIRVRHELRSLTTDEVHTVSSHLQVPARGSAGLDVRTQVPSPRLWSDADPNLYRLTTALVWSGEGEEITETADAVVGIRLLEFDPDTGFHVNGERRVLRGVCLHEDAGCLGTAVPAQVWLRRLLSLKRMGCNAIRMAHNPHAPELYTLCDTLGFFVIDEAFDEWENPKNKWWHGHNVYPPRHQGYAKDFPEWHERDLVAMIDAHRHHPSIIAWSIGNEIDYPNDPYAHPSFSLMTGNNDRDKPEAERLHDPNRPDMRRLTTIAHRLAEITRAADPSRPVTVAAAFPELSSRIGFLDPVDVVGYNYKEHLYPEDHRRFPDKPLLGSENGHHYGGWRAVTDNDYIAGQFLWTGIDYLGEAHGWPIHGSGAGLLTLAGFEKPTWHLRRSWWSEEPVAHLATRPYPGGEEATLHSHPIGDDIDTTAPLVEVLCFANGDDVRLTWGGEDVPVVRDEEHGWWVAVASPREEPLVLEARRDGVVVARDELKPRRAGVRLEATTWQTPADAADRCSAVGLEIAGVTQVECVLRDESGNPARGEAVVTAEVDGGELLGLENGDLADNTPYGSASRSTLDGRLIAYVRSDGPATLRLSAPGLEPVTVDCGP